MPTIRKIQVKNFRCLKDFAWNPSPGLNCLIGAGDAGKSTILDAIDIGLGSWRSFSDSDFHLLNTQSPIEIRVTLGDLPDELKNIESYGEFLRGYDSEVGAVRDEPSSNLETVITTIASIGSDLELDWRLYSERAEASGYERTLRKKHRALIASSRLGSTSHYHFSWGNRSILNKLSDEVELAESLKDITRNVRTSFSSEEVAGMSDVLDSVKSISCSLGVKVGEPQALVDIKGLSVSAGSIALHDENKVPLHQLGTGSSRILIGGLHKLAASSEVILIDEAEYGLEPFRISRLLHELGAKDESSPKQVFITTHSPHVIRELKAEQLHVVRKLSQEEPNFISHFVRNLDSGSDQQATVRACAEGFLGKRIIVCEGKTEIGLISGLDLYFQSENSESILANGTVCADGHGDSLFLRAKIFRELGYEVAILKDSDKATAQKKLTAEAVSAGIEIFEWQHNWATEQALMNCCPAVCIPGLLNIAVERVGKESVDATIKNHSNEYFGLDECISSFDDRMRQALGEAAKKKNWFKDIEVAEKIARDLIGPLYADFSSGLTDPLSELFQFARSVE